MTGDHPREIFVVRAADELSAAGMPREHLRTVMDAMRVAWQLGFDAAAGGVPDVMRDDVQLHHAVIAGIRCYRSHHAETAAAKGLDGWETASLTKRIVGNLKSLAKGSGFVAGSKSQAKQQRRLHRRAAVEVTRA